MMILKNYKNIWLLAFAVILIASCNEDDYDIPAEIEIPLTSGNANLSTYVSVGNSLTAGYTDGALFFAGQNYSMPNLLAQKFAMVGGGEFTQPLTNIMRCLSISVAFFLPIAFLKISASPSE